MVSGPLIRSPTTAMSGSYAEQSLLATLRTASTVPPTRSGHGMDPLSFRPKQRTRSKRVLIDLLQRRPALADAASNAGRICGFCLVVVSTTRLVLHWRITTCQLAQQFHSCSGGRKILSGYLSEKVNDMNSGHVSKPAPYGFRMGRSTSPSQLSDNLKNAIIGQDEAIDAVVRALTIAAAGIRDPHRPIASLLFVGPTGVGKTELARRLAAEVTGDPDKLCRIDMNSLAQEHYSASISGAPPGYAGSKEQFTLFNRELVEGNISRPGIVLFDEVEKAHATVLRSLLQVLDTGMLNLTSGTSTISFRNSIVLLTSNLGSAEIATRLRATRRTFLSKLRGQLSRTSDTIDSVDDAVSTAVEEFFDPELFNRFDEIVQFKQLTKETSRSIVDLELARLQALLSARNISWSPSEAVLDHLVHTGFDAIYGARNLRRAVRLQLHAPIARVIISTESAVRPLHILTEVRDGVIIATAAKCTESRER